MAAGNLARLSKIKNVRAVFVTTFALVIGASTLSASAQPQYDIRDWCTKVATTGNAYSATIFQSCMSSEQSAYSRSSSSRMSVTSRQERWCDQVARSGGSGSYSIYTSCLEQEEAANRR